MQVHIRLGFNRNIVECKSRFDFERFLKGVGFNRNIVECKFHASTSSLDRHLCFNRNIVECKLSKEPAEPPPPLVLIETLWNVNQIAPPSVNRAPLSFNRNIVECKLVFTCFLSIFALRFNRNIVECKLNDQETAEIEANEF